MGGGWGGLNCLSFFHYSSKLVKKAVTVRLDRRVLPNCKGKRAMRITRDAGIVALLMWIKRDPGISHTPIQCRGECWGLGKPVVFLLVSGSRPTEIPMWWQDKIAARCWVFFSWRNKLGSVPPGFAFALITATTKSKRLRWWHSWLCRDGVQFPAVSCFLSMLQWENCLVMF